MAGGKSKRLSVSHSLAHPPRTVCRLRAFGLRHVGLIALCGITVLAAVLRLVAIDHLPPGLYHDEAFNGLDTLSVLRGQTPIFFPANNGREPLFIYLLAIAVAVLGRTPGALRRLSSARLRCRRSTGWATSCSIGGSH